MAEGDVRRYRRNVQDEVDSAMLYRTLADLEADEALAEVYDRLAATEEDHAEFWREKIRDAGGDPSDATPSRRARVLAWLARRFGPGVVLPVLQEGETAGGAGYAGQPEAAGTAMAGQEQSHARVLRALSGSGGATGARLARLEGRHRSTSGNSLRAAVLGANDGLVSNLSLVMGVAGAALQSGDILLTGLAGLVAGAGSMAMGEWLSVQSSRELYERQIDIEAEELREVPEEEAEELALIYQSKGVPAEQARELADSIVGDEATALDTLAREELGIDPEELGGSAAVAAVTSFVLFALGAIVPVAPFAFLTGTTAVLTSVALSAVALFGIGAGITLLTGRSLLYSGARQVGIGLAAAALTYGVGTVLGVAVVG